MQIITPGSTRADLTNLVLKLQETLVPGYFESVTLTPCQGSAPTQNDPSIITFKYSDNVYVDLFIGAWTYHDQIEFRGDGITGTGKIRVNSDSTSYSYNYCTITDIVVTDSGVALFCRSNSNQWNDNHFMLVIGKNADGATCACAFANFNGNEPWNATNLVSGIQNYPLILSYDFNGGKSLGGYNFVSLPYPRYPANTSTLIMQNVPTINGKPFKDVFTPMYNPFLAQKQPFMFTVDGVSYAGIRENSIIFKSN